MQIKKIQLGKLLLDDHLITQAQLDEAIAQQKVTGQRLGKVLVDLQFIELEKLLQLLSHQLEIPYIDLKNYNLDTEVVNSLPEFYARRFRAVVLKREGESFLVGMVDPQDVVACDEITRLLKKPIQVALVREDDLLQTIDSTYRRTAAIHSFAEELSAELGKNKFNVSQLGEGLSVSDAPVVKLLQSIFEEATQLNASDIHIEPDENILRIRQRVDGVLQEQIIKEKQIAQALTLRLKLMAGINITEKRLPQDGRFSLKIKNTTYDVRLATLPVQFGESVVMRLLNQSAGALNLNQIGMPDIVLQQFRRILSFPSGLLLITGPTGSGKTTTLYGALNELNSSEKKIITVEDPVEYRLPRINQVQVQPLIDFTFARALRSILRQDPDIVMVGELRDHETVEIALRAALTGHLVLSTLHTNDAISCALRLLDMGAEGYLIAAVLRGVVAQRLVRCICRNCIQDVEPSPQEKIWITTVTGSRYSSASFKRGKGCSYCHRTGFKGQVGVFELLEMVPALENALCAQDTTAFANLAKQQETFHPLVISGLDMAASGITTISEVMRIIGESLPDSVVTE